MSSPHTALSTLPALSGKTTAPKLRSTASHEELSHQLRLFTAEVVLTHVAVQPIGEIQKPIVHGDPQVHHVTGDVGT